MTHDFDLSRRKTLAALGTVGAASAGVGLGTTAFFSDQETFENNALVAGTLDVKASYSVHYSDWSADELDGIDEEDVTMTDHGTFDPGPRTLPGIEFATEGDLQQYLDNTELRDVGDVSCPGGTDAEDLEGPVIDLTDVKPGDFGEVTFDFALCDNPGYVWLQIDTAHAVENGYTEPERDDPDESGVVPGPEGEFDPRIELLDVVRAAYWIDDGDNYVDGDESFASSGTLREIIDELAGLGAALPGDLDAEDGGGTGSQGCFSGETEHSVAFVWWVPVDHGNEAQSDSVEFELDFYAEQCRHNDGSGDDLSSFLNADAVLKGSPVWDGQIKDATGQSETVVDVGATTSVDAHGFSELPVAFDPQVVRVSAGTTVQWEWLDTTPPIPHNVVSLDESGGTHLFANPQGEVYQPGLTYDFTFSTPGTYLYYCHPHGAPHLVPSVFGGEILNEFGMRGAVIVED